MLEDDNINYGIYYQNFNSKVPETVRTKNVNTLICSLPLHLSEALTILCENSGLTLEEIAYQVNINDRTLRNWRKDSKNVRTPPLDMLVKFCYGLYLPPEICEYLWRCAGRVYRQNDYEQNYKKISEYYYLHDIETINIILKDYGLKQWTELL